MPLFGLNYLTRGIIEQGLQFALCKAYEKNLSAKCLTVLFACSLYICVLTPLKSPTSLVITFIKIELLL